MPMMSPDPQYADMHYCVFSPLARLGANGYSISDNNGVITSPGYPGQYPANDDEVWTVNLTSPNQVEFFFVALDLEDGDEVTIMAGGVNETFPKPSQQKTWISENISSFVVSYQSGTSAGVGFILNYRGKLIWHRNSFFVPLKILS